MRDDYLKQSIWKNPDTVKEEHKGFYSMGIEELDLPVRAYNCLKRSNCSTIGDIMRIVDDPDRGLKHIRNLGEKSEHAILERISAYKDSCKSTGRNTTTQPVEKRHLIYPGNNILKKSIAGIQLSERSRKEFEAAGVTTVGQLYDADLKSDPGWLAVRELYERLLPIILY